MVSQMLGSGIEKAYEPEMGLSAGRGWDVETGFDPGFRVGVKVGLCFG